MRAPGRSNRVRGGWLLALLLLAATGRGEPLELAIRFEGERLVRRVIPADAETTAFDAPGVGRVEVRRGPDDRWRLDVTPQRSGALEVSFPFAFKPGGQEEYERGTILYPHLLGVSITARHRGPWKWWGVDYPGGAFAPLMIWTTGDQAVLVAAENWPPRRVRPMLCQSGLSLDYRLDVQSGRAETLHCVVAAQRAADGREAWQAAVDRYRDWLRPRMAEAGLTPAVLPERIRDSAGWLNVQLENIRAFDAAELRGRCQQWSEILPWVQFWGQMSHYAGPPQFAVPARSASEEVGCCLATPRLHERYGGALEALAGELAASGWVGFYTRPEPEARLDALGAGQQFLVEWLERTRREWNANAYYVDTIGGHPYGEDPLAVARFILSRPQPLVIERVVDIYPVGTLVSGSLQGPWPGGPRAALGRLPAAPVTAVFPGLGRYLLRERTLWLGQSNGDFEHWGSDHDYWTERQAFLLGAKFDVITPHDHPQERGRLNQAIAAAVAAWRQVSFWQRGAQYHHKLGITDEPPGVDARRFVDERGQSLIAIDNWSGVSGALRVDGRPLELPRERLALIELGSGEESGR